MPYTVETSDRALLDLLRASGRLRIAELTDRLGVTATAVRQRMRRLIAAGLVDRSAVGAGRGRPWHVYSLTELGRREFGSNFADMAVALWDELRSIRDPEIRRGLLGRVTRRLAGQYHSRMAGATPEQRMREVATLLQERKVPFHVETQDGLPVLKALACPYTELAERDRSVCAMERMLFSDLVGAPLHLAQCRLDGEPCCTFHPPAATTEALT